MDSKQTIILIQQAKQKHCGNTLLLKSRTSLKPSLTYLITDPSEDSNGIKQNILTSISSGKEEEMDHNLMVILLPT